MKTPYDPTAIIEIGFGVDPSDTGYLYIGDPSRGLIGTGKIGPGTIWTDVTAYVRGFSYDIGKNRANDTWKAGTCTVELNNNDGRFDPANLSGPYVSGGISEVAPMRPIRIREQIGGNTYTRYTGFVDDIILTYPLDNAAGIATIPATDGSKVLANVTPSAVASIGAGEDSGARFNRVLDNISWPSADRDIDTGDITLQGTTLSTSPLDELDLVTFCEGGEMFMSTDGKVSFRRRSARLEDGHTPVDSFDDTDYSDIVPKNDADLVINDIAYTSPDATAGLINGTSTYLLSADVVETAVTGTPDASNLFNDVSPLAYSTSSYLTGTAISQWTYTANVNVPSGSLQGYTITGVHLNYVAARVTYDSAITPIINMNGVTATLGPTIYSVIGSTTPTSYSFGFSANPVTGTAWTSSDIESFSTVSSIGFVIPGRSVGNERVYLMSLEVDYIGVGAGGAQQTAADTASQSHYLVRSDHRDDLLLETDADTRNLASWNLYTHKTHESRFEQVTFRPARDQSGALWGRLLALKFFDRITLTQTPPSGITTSGDYFIIGVSENVSMQSKDAWSITFNLESATPYTGFLIVGDATLGLIGTGMVG